MKIYIASDHRGFNLKQRLIPWLKQQGYRVVDCGPEIFNPLDDYVDYARKVVLHVTRSVLHENVFGILICGSGIGMSIAANRHKGIRAGLGFSTGQITHGRKNDNINALVLDADNIDQETNIKITKAFLETKASNEKKYLRRQKKLDEID